MMTNLLCLFVASAPIGLFVKVDGDGYLRFARDGQVVYAREAELSVQDGKLCHTPSGAPVLPTIRLTSGVRLWADLEGNIFESSSPVVAGRLVLALLPEGSTQPGSSGLLQGPVKAPLGNPGEGLYGVIRMSKSPTVTQFAPQEIVGSSEVRVYFEEAASSSKPQLMTPKAPQAHAMGSKPKIVVRELSEVESSEFRLGDIATIQAEASLAQTLSSIPIGQAPPYGVERGVDLFAINAKLRMAGHKPEQFAISVPASAKVTRKGQKVAHEQFVQAAIEEANRKYSFAQRSCPKPDRPMIVPFGALNLVVESISSSGQQVSAVVAVYVDGARFNARTIALFGSPSGNLPKVGSSVKVRLRSNSAVVETTGSVKAINGNKITVETAQKATLTGTLNENGIVEVSL